LLLVQADQGFPVEWEGVAPISKVGEIPSWKLSARGTVWYVDARGVLWAVPARVTLWNAKKRH